MPVFEAEAIVLRHYSLSESSRIVVFFTREYGKIRAVADGIKKPKSRMTGAIEPFNHVHAGFWFREGKDLGRIRGTDLIGVFPGKAMDIRRICVCSYFAEIINEIVQENQANQPLFRLLLASMKAAAAAEPTAALVRYFEIWALRLNGLLPNLTRCSICGKDIVDEGFFACVESGEARCRVCAGGAGLHVSAKSAASLEKMMKLPPEEFMILPFEQAAASELERFAQWLLGFNLERQLKSWPLLRDALQS
jgi:DNA repair protein RecO (recombination protein O)